LGETVNAAGTQACARRILGRWGVKSRKPAKTAKTDRQEREEYHFHSRLPSQRNFHLPATALPAVK
jgi:hypothetical protein